jgi:hypothetical protein
MDQPALPGSTTLKTIEATKNKGIRIALGAFCVCKTKNILEEAGHTSVAQLRKMSTIKTAIHISAKPTHPLYCETRTRTSQYAKKPPVQPLFRRTDEYFRMNNIELSLVEKDEINHGKMVYLN